MGTTQERQGDLSVGCEAVLDRNQALFVKLESFKNHAVKQHKIFGERYERVLQEYQELDEEIKGLNKSQKERTKEALGKRAERLREISDSNHDLLSELLKERVEISTRKESRKIKRNIRF